MAKASENVQLSLLNGYRDQTLHRLRTQPWTFSNEEMDRLLFNFYKNGALSLSECWDTLIKRVEYRARNSSDLRARLEGMLLLAVALNDRQAQQRFTRLLEKLKQTNIQIQRN